MSAPTMRRPAAPRALTPHEMTLRDRARAKWAKRDRSTWDIARELGIGEAAVCRMLVRPGEMRMPCPRQEWRT